MTGPARDLRDAERVSTELLADLTLQSDPLTQNRYAFAGGNPVNNIEFDGHVKVCRTYDKKEVCRDKPGGGRVLDTTRRMFIDTTNDRGAPERRAARIQRTIDERKPSAVRNLERATGINPVQFSFEKSKIEDKRKDDGGWDGVTSAVSDAGTGIKNLVSDPSSLVDAALHPGRTAEAIANTCDNHSTEYCVTSAVLAIIGGKGTTSVAGKLSRRGAPKAGREASNIANGPRLAADLTRREAASVFDDAGRLHPDVIARSQRIIPGQNLKNPAVIKELTRDGSSIADWGKYTTQTFRSPSGPFQVHYYRNRAPGTANYNIDYKAVFTGAGP